MNRCPVCGKAFREDSMLVWHFYVRHLDRGASYFTRRCICDKEFPYPHDFENHLRYEQMLRGNLDASLSELLIGHYHEYMLALEVRR